MKIPAIYIEKDYWVSYTLFNIFKNNIGSETIFKGGTALSKCYGIIDRFSEDIDLAVLRREGESNNQLRTKIKTIGKVVNDVLPEIEISGITHKMGMNRKTAHSFSKAFQGKYGQVRDVIIVEATWLGYFEPYTTKNVCSFVGQSMIDNNQSEIAQVNGLLPFEVNVLEPTRTICEKIMSLVRFSYSDDPIADLKNKIRHFYDLHQLLSRRAYLSFFNSKEFDDMLLKVAQDDATSFRNNNKWLAHHPIESVMFSKPEEIWQELKSTYDVDFRNLVYGDFPDESVLLNGLIMIGIRLKAIDWKVKLDD